MGHPSRTLSSIVARNLWVVALAFAAASFLLHPAALNAQDGQPCTSAIATAAMLNCENVRYEKAQRELNAMYERLLNKQDAIGKGKLRAAEITWLQFRKANADFLADAARGGTMAPLLTITALTEMTEARTRDLKKSLQ